MSTTKELVYIVRDEKEEIIAFVYQDMKKRSAVVYGVEEKNAEEVAELMGGELPIIPTKGGSGGTISGSSERGGA